MSLNAVLKSLEDAAEVGVQLAEHQLTKDSAGNFGVKPLENVCFTLDALKPRKRAKAANALTFGAKLDMGKLRLPGRSKSLLRWGSRQRFSGNAWASPERAAEAYL
eukprot:s3753_g2.t1